MPTMCAHRSEQGKNQGYTMALTGVGADETIFVKLDVESKLNVLTGVGNLERTAQVKEETYDSDGDSMPELLWPRESDDSSDSDDSSCASDDSLPSPLATRQRDDDSSDDDSVPDVDPAWDAHQEEERERPTLCDHGGCIKSIC